MAQQPELQALLITILGNENVYFQPPPSLKMQYPCIVYRRDSEFAQHADNFPYKRKKRYQVIHIDRDPNSLVPDRIGALSMCVFDRFYTADNLNHDVYKLFF